MPPRPRARRLPPRGGHAARLGGGGGGDLRAAEGAAHRRSFADGRSHRAVRPRADLRRGGGGALRRGGGGAPAVHDRSRGLGGSLAPVAAAVSPGGRSAGRGDDRDRRGAGDRVRPAARQGALRRLARGAVEHRAGASSARVAARGRLAPRPHRAGHSPLPGLHDRADDRPDPVDRQGVATSP